MSSQDINTYNSFQGPKENVVKYIVSLIRNTTHCLVNKFLNSSGVPTRTIGYMERYHIVITQFQAVVCALLQIALVLPLSIASPIVRFSRAASKSATGDKILVSSYGSRKLFQD